MGNNPENKVSSLFQELKRRKVIRVAVAYAIVGWLVIQVADATFEPLRLPAWTETLVVVLALIGFPIAIVIAWAFEATPAGIRREKPVAVDGGAGAPDASRSVPDASIAVLPFTNVGNVPGNEYFSDGLADQLLMMLSRISSLHVCSRTSSFSFKGKGIDVPTVAGKLGVRTVLEGSVQRAGNRIKITAQLIDATSDRHLWGETYNREAGDIFAVQDDIAEKIVEALQLTLTSKERRAVTDQTTDNVQAYDYYLRGRDLFHRSDPGHLYAALGMFDKAIALDPQYALAHAGRAHCLVDLYYFHGRRQEHLTQAVVSSEKAVACAGHLAESHAARGVAHWAMREFDRAEQELETAIALNPTLFEALYSYARLARIRGEVDKSISLSRRAAAARPDDFQALGQVEQLCRESGRFEEADQAARETLKIAERAIERNPQDSRAMLYAASSHRILGNVDAGKKLIERAIATAPEIAGTYYNAGCFYAQIGDAERAIDLLERAYDVGHRMKDWFEKDGDLDPLRQHPRFKALLERLE